MGRGRGKVTHFYYFLHFFFILHACVIMRKTWLLSVTMLMEPGTWSFCIFFQFSIWNSVITSNNGSEAPTWTEFISQWEKKRCRHLTCWGCPCVSALSFTFSPWSSASLFSETPFFGCLIKQNSSWLPENYQAPSPPNLSATLLSKQAQNQQKTPHSSTRHKPWKKQQWYAIGFVQQFENHF